MKNTNAASLFALFCTSVMAILVATDVPVQAVEEFKVGDDLGWIQPDANHTSLYSQWAARNRFHVGDSLSFEYKNDSVLVVNKYEYYHCNTSKPIAAFNNGKSVVRLDRPGPFYFISGVPDHCKNGQRLFIDVMSLHPISPSPPSIAFPPALDEGSSPSPSPSSGVPVSVTLGSVFMAVTSTFVTFLCSAA
ncbi:hypothetical protein I3843_01G225000 [Carya illinoinensis]|uniref:Phytocyanin domain-containing protein n=1 Tax=Carya illinoinensis TaxID=32201 RepID=A0A8T1RRR3_CARIL|nr:early nodulin-like protein 1 [Carya illinoinensis]KAG2728992.1 hypothetical protein I3760_01G229900 [Carya illinoinensis]KAG6669275.1 hypothetical protein CIPAW_01G233100 [Carya illinoinensis]KAG6733640.1 hypothetical protein I3842_01G234400 [Carya illinoinensis]KAG7997741.1 hypothetical protein I3843_01G225000 [Carya illinoinensis]